MPNVRLLTKMKKKIWSNIINRSVPLEKYREILCNPSDWSIKQSGLDIKIIQLVISQEYNFSH